LYEYPRFVLYPDTISATNYDDADTIDLPYPVDLHKSAARSLRGLKYRRRSIIPQKGATPLKGAKRVSRNAFSTEDAECEWSRGKNASLRDEEREREREREWGGESGMGRDAQRVYRGSSRVVE